MKIAADLHVHIYPEYSFLDFFKICFKKLENLNLALGVICLTETNNCNYFEELSNKESLTKEYKLIELKNSKILIKDSTFLVIFPGFQINTVEKIEILALFKNVRIASGLSLEETIAKINKANGISVINWAPGKWLGKRGELIKDFILNSDDLIFLGDSSHRLNIPYCSAFVSLPKLMKLGLNKGLKIIYGSDLLPFKGEEKEVFSYYSQYKLDLTKEELNKEELTEESISKYVEIIKAKIKSTQAIPAGKRNLLFKFFYRQLMLRIKK